LEIEAALRELVLDRSHGASRLATRALALLAALGRGADRVMAARQFAAARPSMVVLANEMGRFLAAVGGGADADAYLRARQAEREGLVGRVAAAGAPLLAGRGVAISYSETLAAALAPSPPGAKAAGGTVWVMESRPLREGVALSQALRRAGREAIAITDAAAAIFCARADFAVAGADAVLAEGAVVNKAGTDLLALAARAARIPFYVLAETAKVTDLRSADVILEEKDAAELGAPADLPAHNIYFEVTPARLIAAIITEEGRLTARERRRLSREAAGYRRLLGGG
jgi:translation initiation factor 2B subunit (eIF-2B alpha/beta/delta family)